MSQYSLTLNNLTKSFGRRLIFKNINSEFFSGNIYGFAGSNGSGKSTLAKIVVGLLTPNSGKVIHSLDNKVITPEELHTQVGFVSPYLVLYDEFTAEENIKLSLSIRGLEFNRSSVDELLNEFGLYRRRNDFLKAYSSGMKQRMKFIFALVHNPMFLLFDEPTSNLDIKGKDTVYKIIERESKEKLIILASNELNDLELCKETLFVENYKVNGK